jgi:HD-GYP domain-containing protein (c-di-GMP phosphodiesterase class II)
MRMAGMLHDLRMIGVRDDILNKPGPLHEGEWENMRRHPDIGADLIAWHPALAAAAPVVRTPPRALGWQRLSSIVTDVIPRLRS